MITKQSAFYKIEPLYWSFYIEIQQHPVQILLMKQDLLQQQRLTS